MKKLALTVALMLGVVAAQADGYAYYNFGPGGTFDYQNAWGINSTDVIGFQFTASISGELQTIRAGMTNWQGDTLMQTFLYTDSGNKPWNYLGAASANTVAGSWGHQVPPIVFDYRSANVLLLAGHKYWLEVYSPYGNYNRWNFNNVGAQGLAVEDGSVVPGTTMGAFSVWVGPIPG